MIFLRTVIISKGQKTGKYRWRKEISAIKKICYRLLPPLLIPGAIEFHWRPGGGNQPRKIIFLTTECGRIISALEILGYPVVDSPYLRESPLGSFRLWRD